jgi:DNA-binding LacI/PurR family transcriptional regulator
MSRAEEPGVPIVSVDHASFVNRALEILVARGRRRIAVLENYHQSNEVWEEAFARFGLPFHSHWFLKMPLSHPDTVRCCVQLLLHTSRLDQPDGVIIADDNLVPVVTAGLMASGAEIPRDLEIVAHCNYPFPPESHVPVHWLGFDVPAMLKICLQLVDAQRRNQPVELSSMLAALTPGEVAKSGSISGKSQF